MLIVNFVSFAQAGFNKIMINDMSFVDGMRNPLRNTSQAHTGMPSSRHFLCCRWRHPEKSEIYLAKLSPAKSDMMRKLLWEAFEWTRTIGVAGRGGDRTSKAESKSLKRSSGSECTESSLRCSSVSSGSETPTLIAVPSTNSELGSSPRGEACPDVLSAVDPYKQSNSAIPAELCSKGSQPLVQCAVMSSASVAGHNTLLDLLASAAAYTPARDFLNQFHTTLGSGSCGGAAHRPPQFDAGKMPCVGVSDSHPQSAQPWNVRCSDAPTNIRASGLPSMPFGYSSPSICSLGKRDLPCAQSHDAASGNAMTVDRILADVRGGGECQDAIKRARVVGGRSPRRGETEALPGAGGGPLLPPIRLVCSANSAMTASGQAPPPQSLDSTRVPVPTATRSLAPEPLMPLSLALWPHSGPGGGGGQAAAPRMLPVSRMDWPAAGMAANYPATQAAVTGSS